MADYPIVVISPDHYRSLAGRENAKSAFLPHDETVWKRAMHAWLVSVIKFILLI